MTPTEWTKTTWDDWADKTVRAICFPLPPAPIGVDTRRIIYMPDSFTSKTYDFIKTVSSYEVISIVPSEYGPAVLAYVPLFAFVRLVGNGLVMANRSTFCASVSAYRKTIGKHRYAFEADLNDLTLRLASCNPMSHYVVPEAPHLTALLQQAQASEHDRIEMAYVSPFDLAIGGLFPDCRFDRNREVDSYLSRCVLNQSIPLRCGSTGVLPWARPYVRRMRQNLIDIQEHDYGSWSEREDDLFGGSGQENGGATEFRAERGRVQGEILG